MRKQYGYSPDRVHSIRIRWSYPLVWDEKTYREKRADRECGWYYVTRKWGNVETAIYIGKARGTIYRRVLQHKINDSKTPFLMKKGEILVRFGNVENPSLDTTSKISAHYHTDRFLKTVESALIQFAQPMCNISQIKSYTRWYKLKIENVGINSDLMARMIDNREDKNAKVYPSWWEGELE